MHNTMKLYCVYWTLQFISFVSSGLLFFIVASEGIPGPIYKIKKKHGLVDNITLKRIGKHQDEIFESLNVLNSDIQLGNKDKTDTTKIYSVNKESVDKDESISLREDVQSNSLSMLKESVSQQPNLSQGISQTGQPVIITLADTATAELKHLAEPHLSSDSRAQESLTNISQTSTSSVEIDTVVTKSASSVSSILLPIDDSNTNRSDELNQIFDGIESESDENLLLVVKAKQKSIMESSINTDEENAGTDERIVGGSTDSIDVHDSVLPGGEFDDLARSKIVSGGTSEQTSGVIIDTLDNPGTVGHHEDIPSFSEWTQKRLEEAEKEKTHSNASIQNPGSPGRGAGGMKIRSKNYASPDCGAKIVAVNPEARSARSVLVSTRDEYMLNTCTSKIWFVVELCEAIQAKKIELANFELFSSAPKDFSIYVNDRFPTRDWSLVGHFTAKDERDIQSFTLRPHLFGKFIKIELHSHYGSEHFCPISLFRAYGTSEFEVLETETDVQEASNDDEHDSNNNNNDNIFSYRESDNNNSKNNNNNNDEDDEDDEEDEVDDEDEEILNSHNGKISKNLFGSARDAVISIVKKAAAVLVKAGNLDTNNITKIQESIGDNIENSFANCMTPRYTILCNNCTDDHLAKVFHLISCQNHYLQSILESSFISHALHQSDLCTNHGVDLNMSDTNFHNSKNFSRKLRCADSVAARFLGSILSSQYIIALCNVIARRNGKLVINGRSEAAESSFTHNTLEADFGTVRADLTDSAAIPKILMTCISDVSNCQTTANLLHETVRYSHDESVIKEGVMNVAIGDTGSLGSIEKVTTPEFIVPQIKPTKTFNKDERKEESSAPILEPSKDPTGETVQAEVVTTPSPLLNTATTTVNIISEAPVIESLIETVAHTKITPLNHLGNHESSASDVVTMKMEADKMKSENESGIRALEKDGKLKDKDDDNIKLTAQEQLSLESLLSDLKDLERDSHVQTNSVSTVTPPAASTTPQQKESVFLRLSNRIKALEQNMSLSGQYLEELSRRYKKQVEEMQRSLERTTATLGEELKKSEERELKRLEEIAILRQELSNLSESIEILLHDRNNWKSKLSTFGQHIALIIIEIAVLISIVSYCRRSSDLTEEPISSQVTVKNEVVRRKSAESIDKYSVMKSEKRRPSEVASVITGTYRELMIDDNSELKRERKKKRKRDSSISVNTNITTDHQVADRFITCRQLNSQNARKINSYPKRWPNSAPYHCLNREIVNRNGDENGMDINRAEKNCIVIDEIDMGEDVSRSIIDGIINKQHRLPTDESTLKKEISQGHPSRGFDFLKNTQFYSPIFIKTAPRSKSGGNDSNGNDQHSSVLRFDNYEWHTQNSESSRSAQDSPSSTLFLDSPNIESHNNGESSTNGIRSDDSGSGSITPLCGARVKKEGSLKKMVRKLF